MQDPYTILGVTKGASADDIKSAYRKLAKQHHPDLGGDAEKFKEISQAYDLLSDPAKKAEYDNGFSNPGFNQYRQGTHYHFEDLFNNPEFMDIFTNAAGFPGARRRARNGNIRVRINVTLSSILKDQVRTLSVNSSRGAKQVEIRIPAGIHDGAVITYRGLGHDSIPDQPAGDLMVEVYIEENSRFQRANDDLYSNITIDCFRAAIGTDIEFETIRGKRLKVTIPPGSQAGTVMRLAGEGLPSMNRTNYVGNQFLKINIMVPTNLTNDELNLIKQIVEIRNGLNN